VRESRLTGKEPTIEPSIPFITLNQESLLDRKLKAFDWGESINFNAFKRFIVV